MSFEVLPNELLVKIFSDLSWDSLRDLSLVNRRWNEVIGPMAVLKLSDSTENNDVIIPYDVLCASSREYRKFSCSMEFMNLQTMTTRFKPVLDYCHHKWMMNVLNISACYDQFVMLLEHHKQLLNDVLRADITVWDNHSSGGRDGKRFKGTSAHDFDFPMEKLEDLSLNYEASSFCSLTLHAPRLEYLAVDRYVNHDDLELKLPGSTKFRSVLISSKHHSYKTDPVELESILSQAPKITWLEIRNCFIETNFSVMFGKLQTIILKTVTLTPTDGTLECPNLTSLELLSVELRKPLKLRVPQLRTLICDSKALQSLQLQDASKADRMSIDLSSPMRSSREAVPTTFPVGISSFRRLHLLLWYGREIDDSCISWICPYLGGITELELQASEDEMPVLGLVNVLKNLPQLNTLRLLKMKLSDTFRFLPATVQNVYLEDCTFHGSIIKFPSTVEGVRVKKLWKRKTNDSRPGVLILANQSMELECESSEERARVMSWLVYSTKR